jgi:hypothetical protein
MGPMLQAIEARPILDVGTPIRFSDLDPRQADRSGRIRMLFYSRGFALLGAPDTSWVCFLTQCHRSMLGRESQNTHYVQKVKHSLTL